MATDPVARFRAWFREARRRGAGLPEACALATATRDGRPSVRFVLLKAADPRGFVFFSDRRSRKGGELGSNPRASLAFYWHETLRQVRVEGEVERVSDQEADAYWATRPRSSQLSAAVSFQSAPMASWNELRRARERLRQKLKGSPVARPPYWVGYRIAPTAIEFWARRAYRLNFRERFTREGMGWRRQLLQP